MERIGNQLNKIMFLICVLLLVIDCSSTFIIKAEYITIKNHPRLLISNNSESEIINLFSTDVELKRVNDYILSECDKILNLSPLQYKIRGFRLLDTSQEALRRIFYLSYAYRITQNKSYAERAINEIMSVCKFKDWNPTHFLDVAEMTMAVAIGYDWLFDLLHDENKKTIITAIETKAIEPAIALGDKGFFQSKTNWNSVCNAGLLFGAIALANITPAKCDSIINKCIASNRRALQTYSPDGGYPEGYGYWGYGTNFEVLLIDVLENNFNTDYNLLKIPGFLKSAYFIQYMSTPNGGCFNFSDCINKSCGNIASWWFAKKIKDNSLLWLEKQYILSEKINIGCIRLLPALIIFASRLENTYPKIPTNQYWINQGTTPVYIYRSGWTAKNDIYLGIKGGSPSTSHAHMDAGSFIFECEGVRWAEDLGRVNYYEIEAMNVDLWDMSQNSQRWDLLHMRNDMHNTLTINNKRHLVDGFANILQFYHNDNKRGILVDLTSTLGEIRKAHREIFLDNTHTLFVNDSIHTNHKSARLQWTMVTSANAEILDKKTICLKKDSKQLLLKIESDKEFTPYILDANNIESWDKVNSKFKRIGFISDLTENELSVFSVKLAHSK